MESVHLNEITKRYGKRTILDKFSLTINQKEFITITGCSGSGKSTLLNIIGLLEDFDEGELVIDNLINVLPNSRKANEILRKKISYLFQNYALIDDQTVEYNIKLALKYVSANRKQKNLMMLESLDNVGLSGYENHRIFELSGGEQQRVALARIMVKPSEIILADEPTGSLDEKNRDIVLDILKTLNKNGKTIILATHDKYVAMQGHRSISLDFLRSSVR